MIATRQSDESAIHSVVEASATVSTADGEADCRFFHPESGLHPGVILWPDILGSRPVIWSAAERLAASGFSVLVINHFYRDMHAPVIPKGSSFKDKAVRKQIVEMMERLSYKTTATDTLGCVTFLDNHCAVDSKKKIGTLGYCMGGHIAMQSAAAVPGRIGAGASFHGGRLVTKGVESPHLLVREMQAHFLFAIAASDDEDDPEAKCVLAKVYTEAGLPAEIEVYQDTMHGWCIPDSRVYNENQAELAWSRLLVLFKDALA